MRDTCILNWRPLKMWGRVYSCRHMFVSVHNHEFPSVRRHSARLRDTCILKWSPLKMWGRVYSCRHMFVSVHIHEFPSVRRCTRGFRAFHESPLVRFYNVKNSSSPGSAFVIPDCMPVLAWPSPIPVHLIASSNVMMCGHLSIDPSRSSFLASP